MDNETNILIFSAKELYRLKRIMLENDVDMLDLRILIKIEEALEKHYKLPFGPDEDDLPY